MNESERTSLRRRLWLHLAVDVTVVIALVLLLRYDLALIRWRYQVLPEIPAHGTFNQVLVGFRDFAQVLTVVVVCVVVAAYDRRWRRIVLVLLIAMGLGKVGYDLTKHAIERTRPIALAELGQLAEASAGRSWGGFSWPNTEWVTQSFPSGHSASAFVLAFVLAFYYPRLKLLWWTLAAGSAASRFVDAVHWPSDCFAGAIWGVVVASVVVRVSQRIGKRDGSRSA